ncbi:MAG: response regulator [Candidatus Omnitrophica bacterium]|nr:response regulator [Candidatus Omnitrophota bacterium]
MTTEIKIKILVVDDEEILRDRLKRLLELDDYEVTTAENGVKGLEEYSRISPDIVLLDIKMPGMDGIEVLDRIKELPHHAEVFIMTGHGGVETAIQALRKGAFDYMTKPVDYDELEINIKRALEKRVLQKKLDAYVTDMEAANRKLKIQGAQLLQAAKLTAVGELSAGVAHEMNQPLMAIGSHLEIILINAAVAADPKLKDKILKIKDQFARLGAIVKRMHDYSSGRSGTYLDESINRPIQDGCYLFSQQLKDHNIELKINLKEDLPKTKIDRYQIQDVSMNFLVNARDAIDDVFHQEPGGIIEVFSKDYPAHNCFLAGVWDNGKAIQEGTESELFNPFFTTKPVGKGTGLGLSVCYNIVKNHNGIIGFTTLTDKSKVFYFALPKNSEHQLADDEMIIPDINAEIKAMYSTH